MRQALEHIIQEIETVIAGKRPVIEKLLLCLLADGHALMDDAPGVGKTTLAAALARATSLTSRRVQLTPDVLPSDITGFTMLRPGDAAMTYVPGAAVGVNLLLADEINRASSRTQAALLEAMEERQVTVDGTAHPLGDPFVVIATMNSVGAAGTQPLPFAQMDRFLMRLSLGYPDHDAQVAMMKARLRGNPLDRVRPVLDPGTLAAWRGAVENVTVSDEILDYISRLSEASRGDARFQVGVSPRGALLLCRAARARAFMDGRDYVTGADVQAVFMDVCAHRVIAAEGGSAEAGLKALLQSVPSPDRRSLPGRRK